MSKRKKLKPAKLRNGWWAHFKDNTDPRTEEKSYMVYVSKDEYSDFFGNYVGVFPTKKAALKFIKEDVYLSPY